VLGREGGGVDGVVVGFGILTVLIVWMGWIHWFETGLFVGVVLGL
jgi:hypothetical protein